MGPTTNFLKNFPFFELPRPITLLPLKTECGGMAYLSGPHAAASNHWSSLKF